MGREPPPRGHDQRRRARRALDLGRVHALLGRAVHGGVPGRLLLPAPRKASSCTTRTCASAAATASTPARSARRSSRRPARSACAARWTSARSAPAAPKPNDSEAEFKKYGRNRLAEGKLPACAEMCSTKALLGGDGDVLADIYRERVMRARQGRRGLGLGDGLRAAAPAAKQAAGRHRRKERNHDAQNAARRCSPSRPAVALAGLRRTAAGRRLQAGDLPGQAPTRRPTSGAPWNGNKRASGSNAIRTAQPGAERVQAHRQLTRADRHAHTDLHPRGLRASCSHRRLACLAASRRHPAAQRRQDRAMPTRKAAAGSSRPSSRSTTSRCGRKSARASPQFTSIPGRETNVLIQSQGQTWRALRNVPVVDCAAAGADRDRAAGHRSATTCGAARCELHGKPTGRLIERFTAGEAARPTGRWRSRFVIAGDHRPHHHVRQERAAAADRLHAVLVARDPRQEPPQLRRPAVRRLRRCCSSRQCVRTTSRARTMSQWIAKFGGMLDRAARRTCRRASSTPARKLWFWGWSARLRRWSSARAA